MKQVNIFLFIVFVIGGIVTALSILNLTNDLPGYLSDPDPRFHDSNVQAGERPGQ